MRKNKNPKTIVFAEYVGLSAFFLRTSERLLGLVTVDPFDETGNPVPPAVWLANCQYHQTGLKDHLFGMATSFLGYAPTELHVFLPEAGTTV